MKIDERFPLVDKFPLGTRRVRQRASDLAAFAGLLREIAAGGPLWNVDELADALLATSKEAI